MDCGLNDIEMAHGMFTFSNKRKGTEEKRTRIDKAVTNEE